ncbi:uncharacterized protein TRIADDRAFT_57257 [Trichoplax adhaerens]|uniref:GTPase Era, mitochondrial n=1 Tax=Trichoplax adhaerens TaxID=10228 RepID=B3RYY2_TRIAD|nr:hypothetical protein TRIADDRAFT_57257 [Trichoplax adhaerens]EDV24104.1 hypothetical protein TRIADDRAFT_57257 [Trichoplax adhaerens]|eukprot:XP_002113630.1 hypothetical protein TRIADDRAFT_57257 [Trichoplax adhaerens]
MDVLLYFSRRCLHPRHHQASCIFTAVNQFQDPKITVAPKPRQPHSPKILKVALLGEPNAGKSTLTNVLVGRKVVPVCRKPQTTRERSSGIITFGSTQIVLVDSPGTLSRDIRRKYYMSKALATGPRDCATDADLLAVLVDVGNKRTRDHLSEEILEILHEFDTIPSVLVLNKVDVIRKEILLDLIDKLTDNYQETKPTIKLKEPTIKLAPKKKSYIIVDESIKNADNSLKKQSVRKNGGWKNFKEVFMISARTGDGVDMLQEYLVSQAKPGNWQYNMKQLTSLSPSRFVEEIIREKLLGHLPHDLPYILKQSNLFWHLSDNGTLRIHQSIDCRRNGQMSIVIGPRGKVIRTISEEAKADLEEAFGCPVELLVKVRLRK